MNIVVKLPDKDYSVILSKIMLACYGCEIIELPKGHGRLIDADAIIKEATKGMKYPKNHEYMECVIAHMNLAPTIIEADEAEQEAATR